MSSHDHNGGNAKQEAAIAAAREYFKQHKSCGVASPSYTPTAKKCLGCDKYMSSERTHCRQCRHDGTKGPSKYRNVFVARCPTCEIDTLHLDHWWSIHCYTVSFSSSFDLYCLQCELMWPIPYHVHNPDRGEEPVNMLEVDKLWCVHCDGEADSWARREIDTGVRNIGSFVKKEEPKKEEPKMEESKKDEPKKEVLKKEEPKKEVRGGATMRSQSCAVSAAMPEDSSGELSVKLCALLILCMALLSCSASFWLGSIL